MNENEFWNFVDTFNPNAKTEDFIEAKFTMYVASVLHDSKSKLDCQFLRNLAFLCYLFDFKEDFGILTNLSFSVYDIDFIQNSKISNLFFDMKNGKIIDDVRKIYEDYSVTESDRKKLAKFSKLINKLSLNPDKVEILVSKVIQTLRAKNNREPSYRVTDEVIYEILNHPLIKELFDLVESEMIAGKPYITLKEALEKECTDLEFKKEYNDLLHT